MGVIIFNGKSSDEIGIKVEKFPNYDIPEKDYDIIHVPGRNGDIVIDTGSYKNITRKYQISVATYGNEFYKTINSVAEWLHSSPGYAILEDSYEPDYYRIAFYRETNSIENIFDEAGRATISFECKPQRFLKDGDTPIVFTENGSITNDTAFISFPIINVTVSNETDSVINVGNYTINIPADKTELIVTSDGDHIVDDSNHKIALSNVSDITINSELQDIYSGTINKNSSIILNGGEFPKLNPGENLISFSGSVQRLEVIPKWWTI